MFNKLYMYKLPVKTFWIDSISRPLPKQSLYQENFHGYSDILWAQRWWDICNSFCFCSWALSSVMRKHYRTIVNLIGNMLIAKPPPPPRPLKYHCGYCSILPSVNLDSKISVCENMSAHQTTQMFPTCVHTRNQTIQSTICRTSDCLSGWWTCGPISWENDGSFSNPWVMPWHKYNAKRIQHSSMK